MLTPLYDRHDFAAARIQARYDQVSHEYECAYNLLELHDPNPHPCPPTDTQAADSLLLLAGNSGTAPAHHPKDDTAASDDTVSTLRSSSFQS